MRKHIEGKNLTVMTTYVDEWLHLPKTAYNAKSYVHRLQLTGVASDYDPTESYATLDLYQTTRHGIAVPRQTAFINPKVLLEAKDLTQHGAERDMGKPIGLRPQQVPLVNGFMDALDGPRPYGGLLQAKPGAGKTVMGLEILRRIGRTALILVHKTFLQNQWQERIAQFLPDAKVGFVRQGVCDFEDKDIVIAMIQSLVSRRYSSAFYKWAGVVLSDEVHRLSAPTWSQVIIQFPAKVRMGLTATPRRKDGMEPVFFWHVGPIISYAGNDRSTLDAVVKVVKWQKRVPGYFLMRNGMFNRSRWITELAKDKDRNWMLTQFILKALSKGRKVLALSDRLDQLDIIRRLVSLKCNPGTEIDYYVGGRKRKELAVASGADLLLGTYQMAAEGLDIPDLDTLVMLTPKSDVEQAVGRIQRVSGPGKPVPVVIDIVDTAMGQAIGMAKARHKIYFKIKAKVLN